MPHQGEPTTTQVPTGEGEAPSAAYEQLRCVVRLKLIRSFCDARADGGGGGSVQGGQLLCGAAARIDVELPVV